MHSPATYFPRPFALDASASILLIILAVLVAYEPVRHNDLVWDDEQNLILNDSWKGLDAEHVGWMFSTFYGGHFQPLTWLSFAFEHQLWGRLNPAAIHATNVLLHALNAVLVFLIARRIVAIAPRDEPDGFNSPALVAALLFAIHPLRVESVAWATERRDVLSGAFLLLSFLLYLRAAPAPTDGQLDQRRVIAFGWFWGAFAAYCLSVLSKATGMTFPLVLLIVDIYPLRGFGGPQRGTRRAFAVGVEKLIFAVPALAAAALALAAQKTSGAFHEPGGESWLIRAGRACYGLCFYVAKTIWPSNLSPLYELSPAEPRLTVIYVICACLVGFALIGAWCVRRKAPGLFTALLLYVVLVAPMLGFAQSGPQLVADRYAYLSCIPLSILIGGGFKWLQERIRPSRLGRRALNSSVALLIVAMTVLTRQQAKVWRDPRTLWTTVIERRPNTGLAHANFAIVLNRDGEFDKAREHARRALEILPGNLAAHLALGKASLALGDFETARDHLEIATERQEHLRKPDASTHAVLAFAYSQLGETTQVKRHLQMAIDLDPSNSKWSMDLAGSLVAQGRYPEAQSMLEDLLARIPDLPAAYLRLGQVQRLAGDTSQAIQTWERGLVREPDDVDLRAQLAWTLATAKQDSLRNVDRAIELAMRTIKDSSGQSVRAAEALAAGHAEKGDFDEAIAVLTAVDPNGRDRLTALVRARIQREIEQYTRHQPVRE